MITNLQVHNFRNYEQAGIDLSPGVTVLAGDNTQGKTNLVEALYLLSTTKSFRTSDENLIRWDNSFFRVIAQLQNKEDKSDIEATFTTENRQAKRFKINGSQITLKDAVGRVPAVLFNPQDIDLIISSPSGRRRYLDIVLSQVSKKYLITLIDYKRALKHRNKLLWDIKQNRASVEELEFWNVSLVKSGSYILEARKSLTAKINTMIGEYYYEVTGEKENLYLDYVSTIQAGGDLNKSYESALFLNQGLDILSTNTSVGPHRDDFIFTAKGRRLNQYASRGEMRTVVIALKMAEAKYLAESSEARPALLLDDVFSELDGSRKSTLLNLVKQYQTIITTTEKDLVTSKQALIYTIKSGKINV